MIIRTMTYKFSYIFTQNKCLYEILISQSFLPFCLSCFPFNKDSQIKPFSPKNSGVISGKLLIGEVAVKADGKTE